MTATTTVATLGFLVAIPAWVNHEEDNKVTCTFESIGYSSLRENDPYTLEGETWRKDGSVGKKEICTKGNGDRVSNTTITEPTSEITYTGTKPAPPVYVPKVSQQQASGCPITTCNDGWCSSSTGRGTCSWHGGVAY